MYKDRIPSPHQLSYSAVTSYQSRGMDQSQHNQYQAKDPIEKYPSSNRTSLKVDQNSDLAFLRNTVGPISTGDHTYLRVNDSKKTDSSLRQTMNVTSNVKDFIRVQGALVEKRTSRAQTVGQMQKDRKNYPKDEQKDDRLQKIMNKYEKKNETKQALKLLEELKQLKKKQEQLKKQRKNDPIKDNQSQKKVTGNGYETNSPINFSKKNKVDYFTPTYENKSLSTNANSPQNESYFNARSKKASYDFTKQEVSINVNSQPYHRPSQQTSLASVSDIQALNSIPSKSSSNLRTYYDHSSDYSSKGFSKQQKNDYLSSSTVANSKYDNSYKSKSPYKPSSSYSASIPSVLSVTTRDNANYSRSPSAKYKENPSYLSQSVSYSSKYSKYETYTSSSSSMYSSSSTPLKDVFMNRKVTISDFILGKNLGQGKFGTVFQAYDKRTKAIYALKKIPKSIIKSHWMVDQFILEVKIQHFCNHPNILSLHGCFDDSQNVYILLEYMQEGTLFLHLKKNTTLNEKQAATRIKEIASAIQYLHENGIAHRDLKPENIVMSHGVCKMCDFGWATICDQRRKTYCGTFDYAAPQILQGEEYDMSVDLWCLGILTYEILVGKAPFYHISRKQTMKKIMNCQNQKISYPSTMSYEAKSFIEQLLKRNPQERLKSEDLLKHPFILFADK